MTKLSVVIDHQKSLEVDLIDGVTDEDGTPCRVLTFNGAHEILSAWMELDSARRNMRYGNEVDDSEPAKIIVAWSTSTHLYVQDVDPFWDGGMTHNGYDLEELEAALPDDAIRWGKDIGEEN